MKFYISLLNKKELKSLEVYKIEIKECYLL